MLVPITGLTESTTTESLADKTSKLFSAGKDLLSTGADIVVKKSGEAWDATKDGASKAADATANAATKGWTKTKDASGNAVDYTTKKIEKLNDLLTPEESAESAEPVVVEKNTD